MANRSGLGRTWPLVPMLAIALVSACTASTGTPPEPTMAGANGISTAPTAPPSMPSKPTATPTVPPTPTAGPSPTPVPTPVTPYSTDEPTRYEGTLKYDCAAGGCWRQGSKIGNPSAFYYPEIEANNAEIAALLSDIGLPAGTIEDDVAAWQTLRALWDWLYRNTSTPTTAPEAWDYLQSISSKAKPDHWPSIANMAGTYARYHTLPWGACNSRALTLATLAYRVGLSPDRLAVAYFKSADASIQHMYVVLRSGSHWYIADPSCNASTESPALPNEPANVTCMAKVDYEHPFTLALLPGSTLTRAMLVK
jgi:hypothetical protein